MTTINERLATVETQVARLVSDAVSEKGTRARSNDRIDKRFDEVEERIDKFVDKFDIRLRCVERNMYIAMGGLAVLDVAVSLVMKFWWK